MRVFLFVLCSLFATPCFAAEKFSRVVVFPVVAPEISGRFGNRIHPIHAAVQHHGGVDLAAPEGSHVRSVLNGRVIFAGVYAGYGKLVTIEHARGRTSLYGHLSEILVNPGQRISAGELLGKVGQTGVSTGPHLHFEWRENGQVLDPAIILPSLRSPPQG